MLLIILALFWVALLAPIAIRYFRNGGTEKSIESFHAEHEILSRQDYTVAPAHRLDRTDLAGFESHEVARRPRLTVVHADDTFGTLESRASWDEWSGDYDYEAPPAYEEPTNHYARAYSSRPAEAVAERYEAPPAYEEPTNHYARAYSSRPAEVVAERFEASFRRRSMRSQRRMMFSRLVLAALVLTVAALFITNDIVTDVAALSWFCVVVFVALAFYSVSQGYLHESSLPRLPRMPQLARRRLAPVAPLHAATRQRPVAEDPYADYFEYQEEDEWERLSQRRHALG